MQKHWDKPFKKIERIGSLVVNNKWIGIDLNEKTEGIVIDHVITRELEHQLKPIRTSNIKLHAGHSTIAVFRIIKRSIGTDTER